MSEPESNIYVGRVERGETVVYAVGGGTVDRLGHFVWGAGAGDSGVALARTVLTAASEAEPPARVCRRFSVQVVQRLPHDGFALPRATVSAWLGGSARA